MTRPPVTPVSAFVARRRALLSRFPGPALLACGEPRARTYRANTYRFRASSHFLYFLDARLPGSALLFAEGRATLFVEPPEADGALWHGAQPSLPDLQAMYALDAVRPLAELDGALAGYASKGLSVATLPTSDAASSDWLAARLGRPVRACTADKLEAGSVDAALADVMIELRLNHDEAAVAQLRAAADGSAHAHMAGMRAGPRSRHEWEVAAAITGELRRRALDDSFQPIVTVNGEVLHNEEHLGELRPGALVLCDCGGETPEGWAGDITRTWPHEGKFSPTQRALYEVVLAAQLAAIDKVRPGVRYRDVHRTAARAVVTGLRDLGIFRGDVDGLLERGAAAIFFPHGTGHLIGLDVHDMEDLHDRAGYAPGRTRSKAFGECYLRLDRDLTPGMAVTIEPGFYQVPAILGDAAYTGAVGADLDREVLARFADVRGIRIEDDVLCTDGDPEVMSHAAVKTPDAIEALIQAARG